MRLLLIRHAPTAETGKILSGRAPGIPLSAEGRVLAEATAGALAAQPLEAIYCSPLQRCRETAAVIATPHRLRPVVRRALTEVDYGDWSGRRLRQLTRLRAWRRLMSTPSRFEFPGSSETLLGAQMRVVAAVEALAIDHPEALVAAVSHNDAIRLVLTHYLGMPLDLFHRLHVGPASFSLLELPPGGSPRVVTVNQAPAGATA